MAPELIMPRFLFGVLVAFGIGTSAQAQTKPAPTPPGGVLPLGSDGKPLNFDFETGTLKDWTARAKPFRVNPFAATRSRRAGLTTRANTKANFGSAAMNCAATNRKER